MLNDRSICLRCPDNGPNRRTNCTNHGRLSSRNIGKYVSEPMLTTQKCISNTLMPESRCPQASRCQPAMFRDRSLQLSWNFASWKTANGGAHASDIITYNGGGHSMLSRADDVLQSPLGVTLRHAWCNCTARSRNNTNCIMYILKVKQKRSGVPPPCGVCLSPGTLRSIA